MLKRNEEWKSKAACRTQAALFQDSILDFDPEAAQSNCLSCNTPMSRDGENFTHTSAAAADKCDAVMRDTDGSVLLDTPVVPDYALLTTAERTDLLNRKKQVEDAAVDVCMGCPVLFQCETWALAEPVYGVAGGRTEAERRAMREGEDLPEPMIEETATSLSIDRGPRNQVDDAAIARMTAQGMDSKTIARDLQCSERSVVRARARLRKAAHAEHLDAADTSMITLDEQTAETDSVDANTTALVGNEGTTPQSSACPDALAPAVSNASIPTGTIEADLSIFAAEIGNEVQQTAPARPKKALRVHKSPRMRQVSEAMTKVYEIMADGQWHDRDALVALASSHISDQEALAFWFTSNSKPSLDGGRALLAGREHVAQDKRITSGATAKAANMLTASARNGGHTERNDSNQYRLTAPALAVLAGQTKARMITAA